MAAFSSAIVCVLVLVGASCAAVIADADSPSPASQPSGASAGAGVRTFSRQMESSIDDLMNALAQVTKSKGNNATPTTATATALRRVSLGVSRDFTRRASRVFINSIGKDVWEKEKHAHRKTHEWGLDGAAVTMSVAQMSVSRPL